MPPFPTHVARSVVCVRVCVLGMRASCANTTEPIEMPFAADSCGPIERLTRRMLRSPTEMGIFEGTPGSSAQRCLCGGDAALTNLLWTFVFINKPNCINMVNDVCRRQDITRAEQRSHYSCYAMDKAICLSNGYLPPMFGLHPSK